MPSARARLVFAVLLATLLPWGARAAAGAAGTAPSWSDTPALLASATAPLEDELRACVRSKLPRTIAMVAVRDRDGTTSVSMPTPWVGWRGLTPEERCLAKTVARISLPPLPAEVERIELLHVITAAGAAPPAVDPAFADWRDPAATLAALLDGPHRAALAACDRKPRTVRLVLDLRRGATRVWLPAWQFHDPRGDGTTPPAERRVRACLTAAIHGWHPPALPRAMGALELAIPVTP